MQLTLNGFLSGKTVDFGITVTEAKRARQVWGNQIGI